MKTDSVGSPIATRLILLWALLSALLVGVFGFLWWQGSRKLLLENQHGILQQEARRIEVTVRAGVADVIRDARTLANTPVVREFVKAYNTPESERWRTLVEETFGALLDGKSSYFQLRLIGVANNGLELIRIDSQDGKSFSIPSDRLQRKGDRDYFKQGLELASDAIFVSDIDLNQDFGKVTTPLTPTLRAVAQVKNAQGAVFGLIVINVNVSGLLDDIDRIPHPGVQLYSGNGRGDYLLHPDATRTFGTDLNRPFSIQQPKPDELPSEEDLHHEVNFHLTGTSGPSMALRSILPKPIVLEGLRQARDQALKRTGIGASLAALGMAFFVRKQIYRLEKARQDAEAATRSKEEFLAVMSHEIRTPLNSVTGLLRVLERNQPAPHQLPVLKSLRVATGNLMSLLNDALDYTKIQAGRVDFDPQDFSPCRMLEDLYQTHRPVALQKGLEFTLHYNGELPAQIRGDALRLGQILNNIVSNALKFTDHGQVTLTAESLPGHCIRFTVEDTGVGIPEAEQNDIFAPFSQVRRTDGRKFDGSGLGLSIARALVEMQGGTLELRSAQGKGSTFTVTLPFAESSAAAVSDELPASAEPPDFKGKRILYVEDVASNQEVMAALLEETGADLRWVETGSDALNTLQKEAFDIALLDLQLPDMSGLELAEKIRNQWPQLPMVAVTAQAGASVNERCLAAGMLGVVLKPIDPARLFAWISQASPEANHSANPTAAESPSQASPGNFRTVLEQLFGKQPERIERMLATLATEFDQHHRVLTDVLETDNIAEIRSLRHKMHSALTQFGMESLRHDLDLLVDAQGNLQKDAELQHRCLAALKSAAEQFRRA